MLRRSARWALVQRRIDPRAHPRAAFQFNFLVGSRTLCTEAHPDRKEASISRILFKYAPPDCQRLFWTALLDCVRTGSPWQAVDGMRSERHCATCSQAPLKHIVMTRQLLPAHLPLSKE